LVSNVETIDGGYAELNLNGFIQKNQPNKTGFTIYSPKPK
jgi:hypothetical protein